MKPAPRSRRRMDLARMKAKAVRVRHTNIPVACRWGDGKQYERVAEHLAVCSCPGCGNPRRWFGGSERLTMQERRASEAARAEP